MDFLAAIRHESNRFYDTAAGADPEAGVPSCPGWSIADLVWHLGEVHWFWATDVESRAESPEQVEAAKPPRPGDYAGLLAFGRAQADRLLSVLAATPDDTPVWTWALSEADHTAGFVRRHQVQEAAVHRWDLQSAAAASPPDPIDPEAAADAIDEFLAVSLPWSVRADKPVKGSIHLHCTDAPGEWLIHPHGAVEPVHAKGDVALRGTACDLLLALYKRIPLDALEVIGNEDLAREVVERVNTE